MADECFAGLGCIAAAAAAAAAIVVVQLADLVELLGEFGLEEAEFGFVTGEELGGGIGVGIG